ncbi:helix-turn-helix protein [Paraburkholderia sp. BL6669N2]|uniref:helix-turn-helix domain-containing protein n=1 Tax=Paraburkholderia sp. BL6669N2 TaxID=1938807 RepID=UPI000E248C2C|nr:helix-turn-helix transcriptional regulator [Paraburkholderia sp. BL6669N2]REG60848.1 helix-turn-helix protein [Paraburkholderia sp. BL6669N2]
MSAAKSTTSTHRDLALLLAEAAQAEDFDFELKAQEVAVNLSSLMMHAGWTRADLARSLDWKPARVSKVLGGKENLTLRTLYAIFKVLGYTFDVVPRAESERAPTQPWQHFSFDNKHVVSRGMKLKEVPTVASQGRRPEDTWPEWFSHTQKNFYKVDFTAANTDYYDAALAS